MDSFVVAFVVTLLRFEIAKRLPSIWRVIESEEQELLALHHGAGPIGKGVIVVAIVWVACYVSVWPWIAMRLDPPFVTALVAVMGSAVALMVYLWWITLSTVRNLWHKLHKA